MRYSLRSLGFALLLVSTVMAQLTVDLDIRPRLEYRDGYKSLLIVESTPAILMSQRSRINFNYTHEQIKARFSLQDVRIWGDESNVSSTGVTGDPASIDLYEAWFESGITDNLNIRIGRQSFKLDDQRLISQRNWNQNGLCYDAVTFLYTPGKWQITTAVSLNNSADNSSGNLYPSDRLKTMNFVHINGPLTEKIRNSVLFIGSGVTANDTTELIYMRGTIGDYCKYSSEKLDFQVAGYHQFGRNKKGLPVSAYLGSLDLQLKLNTFQPGAGLVYISGQNDVETADNYQATDHLFDILYGGRHSFYGLMDYFSNISKSTGGGGLIDVYAKLICSFQNMNIQMDAHRFNLAEQTLLSAGTDPLKSYLGTELDFSFKYKLNSAINLQGGYSVMLPGESLELLQGLKAGESRQPQWLWLMVDFKASLFKGNG